MAQKSRLYNQNTNSNYHPIKSLQYASEGLMYAFKTEPNLWIQFFIGVSLFCLNLYFGHWVLAVANLIFMTMVGSFELINTIIENICDMIDPNYNPKIKIIKDMAAGAVLFVVLTWILIVFLSLVLIGIDIWRLFDNQDIAFQSIAPLVSL